MTIACPTCSAENPAGNKFCGDCGAALGKRCPHCGAEHAPGKRFCGACGAPIVESRQSTGEGPSPASALDEHGSPFDAIRAGAARLTTEVGERRQLTVMFCDLVGSTELSSRLDAEEWRDLMAHYHRVATDVVMRFGGHVAKYLGDGVLALFGYPQAHGDDAERAVRAGLGIVEVVSLLR